MQGFSAIMVLTNDSLLEATEAMQVSVLVVTIAHKGILWHQQLALLATTTTEHTLTLLKIAGSVLEDSIVKKLVLLGLVAHVMLDTIAQKEQCIEIQTTTPPLEVLVLPVTFVQMDHHLPLHALVARTPHSGNRVSAVFVLLVISVQMLQPTSLTVLKVTIAPVAHRQLSHVQKEATRTILWAISLMTAKCAQLECSVSSMV